MLFLLGETLLRAQGDGGITLKLDNYLSTCYTLIKRTAHLSKM